MACAKDAGIEDTGTGGADASSEGTGGASGGGNGNFGGIGASDGGWPIGKFGSPCQKDEHCEKDLICVDIGQGAPALTCVTPCDANKACPTGAYCAFHPDKGYVCVPDKGNQCDPCITNADCQNVGDVCTPSPNVDRFCARDCSFDGQCPSGMTCVTEDGYPTGVPGSGGTAGGDGGVGEAGPPSKTPRICVPQNDESCPCNSERDGVKRRCTQTSGTLVCEGTEQCNGASGKWEGCTAGAPQPETCDGADNDCNGTPDDGTPDKLCASQGNPIHATWACNVGQCEIASCDSGWVNYPPTLPPSAGCPCEIGKDEPNDTCAKATAVGSVTDANTTALNITGRLTSDADSDWYTFDTVDSDEGTTNSYHIKIGFTAPPSNGEFVFDVVRGDACKVPDAKHKELTDYDWCVDGSGKVGGKDVGEKSCGPTAPLHCGPHGKKYFVRVHRAIGVAGTCAQYTLTITAKGGGTCDFTQACDPQVDENL